MANLNIVIVVALFTAASGAVLKRGNTSQQQIVVADHSPKSECGKKSNLRILKESYALLQDSYVPGAGITHFEPFAFVLKDGFMKVTCIKDEMFVSGDKFGDNRHEYKLGAASATSIVHYDVHVAKEDRKPMTPTVCFDFCRTVPNVGFFGIVNGKDCYCTPFFKSMASDSSQCEQACEGDKSLMCGGNSKSSIFSMHMCEDTKEELEAVVKKAEKLVTSIGEGTATATESSEILQKAGEKIQLAFSSVGDSGAGDMGQSFKQFAGTLEAAAKQGKKTEENVNELVADATLLIDGPPTPAPTPAPITLHTTKDGGNDGGAYCSAYCAYNWNDEMPSNFKGACCLSATLTETGEKVSCTEESPIPAPAPPPEELQITVQGNNGAAYCSAYCAYDWNNAVTDYPKITGIQWKGACCLTAYDKNNVEEVSCTSYGSGAGLECVCQKQDDTPFLSPAGSSQSFGDERYVCESKTPPPPPAPAPKPRSGLNCECQIQDTTPFLVGAASPGSFTNTANVCAGPIPPAPTPSPKQPKHFSDPNIQKQVEVVISKTAMAVTNAAALAAKFDKLNGESRPKSSTGAALQYFPVMHFVDQKMEDVPSTCHGDVVGSPIVGDHDACAGACDDHMHDCVGYQFFDLGAEGGTCTLLSNFKTGFYYTGCAKEAPKGKSFLQTDAEKAAPAAPFDATCFAKLSKFEGTSLKPNPSGNCEQCFRDLTKAERCY